jgi:hypothetical protein
VAHLEAALVEVDVGLDQIDADSARGVEPPDFVAETVADQERAGRGPQAVGLSVAQGVGTSSSKVVPPQPLA